jgi:DinB superfamily
VDTSKTESPGESQAKRLEHVYEQVASLLGQPEVASRLRTSAAENEWSAMQTLGHVTEMIPYWLSHCRTLIAATGGPPEFGRTAGSPERLAGVAHGAASEPHALLDQLRHEVRAAAREIRGLSAAQRAKRGRNRERGEMTVADVVESFIVRHAEDHLAQAQAALRR